MVEIRSKLQVAFRAILLALLTMFIAWVLMLFVALVIYGGEGGGHWILLPVELGLIELVAAPLVIGCMVVLRFKHVTTSSSLVFCHALLVLVFVALGAGILGKDNDLGVLSWLPTGAHTVVLLCIAWIGAPMGDGA